MLYLANCPFLRGGTRLRNKCLLKRILPEKNRIQKTISHGSFPSSQVLHDTWYSSCPQLLWIFSMLWIDILTKAIFIWSTFDKTFDISLNLLDHQDDFWQIRLLKLCCLKLKLRSPIIYLQYVTLPLELVITTNIMKSKTKVWKK